MSVDLIRLSDDALNSQYQILFPKGIPGGGSGDNIALRMDQPISIPREAVGEYEIFYKGRKIVKTNMLEETDKHITLQVRIDQNWAVFEDIKNWKRLVYDPINGTRLPIASISCPIVFQMLDGSQVVKQTCTLTQCVLKEFEVMSFEPQGNDPSRVELNIIYQTSDWS